jgi:hypothetical protein
VSATEPATSRAFCSEAAREGGEDLTATASRIEHWLLVEYSGYWPHEPLDAAVFAGRLRHHLSEQLAALPHSRLLLVKRSGRGRRDGVSVMFGRTVERGSRLHRLALEGHPDLLDLDIAAALGAGEPPGEPLDHPLLLACTHGVRDRCCARYGQALCRALHGRADPQWVWQSTHVGGDRFAGNLVVLPEGLYFGWVDEDAVQRVLDAYLAGRIDLEHYRGRSCHPFAAQAAEAHVRRVTALDGLHDLRMLGARRTDPNHWTVRLMADVAGVVHEVDVERELGEPKLLTCKAAEARRPHRWVVRAHRQADA